MKKRLLSIALAMSMVFSCFTSFTVSAEGITGIDGTESTGIRAVPTIATTVSGGNKVKNSVDITFPVTDGFVTTSKDFHAAVLDFATCDGVHIEGDADSGYTATTDTPNLATMNTGDEGVLGAMHADQTTLTFTGESGSKCYTWTVSGLTPNAPYFIWCYSEDSANGKDAAVFAQFALDANGYVVVPHATLTLNLNGGAFTPAKTSVDVEDLTKTFTAAELLTLLGTPTKANSIFKGWSTTNLNSGNNYAAGATVDTLTEFTSAFTNGQTANVYAVWQDKAGRATGDFTVTGSPKTYNGQNQTATSITYKGSAIANTAGKIDIKYQLHGTGTKAANAKNAGSYDIVITFSETADSAGLLKGETITLDNAFVINKASYSKTQPTGNIPLGTTIQGYEFTGTIDGVNGETLAGTFKITSATGSGDSDTVANTSGKQYTGLSYDFTPSAAASSNYEALTGGKYTGTDAKLTAATADPVNVTITEPTNKTYDGTDKKATVAVTKGATSLAEGTDYSVAYVTVNEGTETATTEVKNAATYKVTVTLNSKYSTTNDLTKTYTIEQKELTVVKNPERTNIAFTKPYDGTNAVKVTVTDGDNKTVRDPEYDDFAFDGVVNGDSVNLSGGGGFAPTYADANAAADKKFDIVAQIRINGVDNANYKLPAKAEFTGAITAKDIKATLKTGVTKSKVFGSDTPITFALADFDLDPAVAAFATEPVFASVANDANKAVGDYAITVTNNDPNYNVVVDADSKASVTKAAYVLDGTITTNVGVGVDLATPVTITVGAATDVKVKGVDGNPVAGTIAISSETSRVTTDADAENADGITGLNWVFTPTTADANYGEFKGNNAVVKVDKAPRYAITINVTGGTATVDAANNEAIEGATVTVTPTVGAGYTGNGTVTVTKTASGDAVAVTDNKFTMPAEAVTVTVTFDKLYNVTVVNPAEGTITVDKATAKAGEEVTITEIPAGGTAKVTYTKDDAEVVVPVTDNKFTMPAADVTVTATFAAKYAIDTTGVTGGTVTVKSGDEEITEAAEGDEVTLTVTPDADHKGGTVTVTYKNDQNEDVEVPVDADGKFTMPAADVKVSITFSSKHSVTVKAVEDGGTGTAVADKTTAFAGDEITVTPTVTSGKIKSVTAKDADGNTIKTTAKDGKYVVVMPDSNVEITVTFGRKSSPGSIGGGTTSYTVKYSAGDHGTLDGVKSESVESGKKPVKVPTVVPMEGYSFKGWSTDGETTVDPTTVEIKKTTTFTALYEEVVPTPTPTAKPEGVSHKLYMHGYEEDGSFRADAPIKRAEVATMFAYSLTDYTPGQSFENPYWDVAEDAWYTEYVSYLANLGIIEGYEDGTFRPEEAITRQEFATMLAKLGEVLPAGEMPFSDVSAEEQWGIDYIYTTYANGWVEGYEDGTFRPDNWITRAEAVKMVNGYLNRVVDASTFEDVEYHDWYDVDKSHWAYYEILEASNDHTCTEDTPEKWLEVGQFGY